MDIDIRKYIRNNSENASADDIRSSIEESVSKGDEVTLPGLGVLFEILWKNSDDDCKEKMLDMLASNLK
jgi:small acid-soluble spore protein I (minor)